MFVVIESKKKYQRVKIRQSGGGGEEEEKAIGENRTIES